MLDLKNITLIPKRCLASTPDGCDHSIKGEVEYHLLDSTYMDFKVNYLLGENWEYKTTKHIWLGDAYTEYFITKKQLA